VPGTHADRIDLVFVRAGDDEDAVPTVPLAWRGGGERVPQPV